MSSARRKRDLATVATHSSQKLNPGRDKRLLLSAIGQCLKAQYGALAAPIPPRLAARQATRKAEMVIGRAVNGPADQ
jgi:hypothetical protein